MGKWFQVQLIEHICTARWGDVRVKLVEADPGKRATRFELAM
jgi:hypothetical protein